MLAARSAHCRAPLSREITNPPQPNRRVNNGRTERLLLLSDQQPNDVMYRRQLAWVRLGLWNTFGNADPTFIRRLYGLIAHPSGGWRSSYTSGAEPFGLDQALDGQ